MSDTCNTCHRPMTYGPRRGEGVARKKTATTCSACYERAARALKSRTRRPRLSPLVITPCGTCARPMAYGTKTERPDGVMRQKSADQCASCRDSSQRAPSIFAPHAHAKDRAPLLAEDGIVDDIAVEYAALGRKDLRLTQTELRLASDRLTAYGCSSRNIADVLGTSARSVVRYRSLADLGLTLVAA